MLQCLPLETLYEVTHWFEKRFRGDCQAPDARKLQRLVFHRKPDASLEKRATWNPYDRTVECVLQMVHDGSGGPASCREGADWRSLHVGGWKGVNCEHVQALLTKILPRRWSGRQTIGPIWNRDSPDTRRPSWQAWTKKTAFDVAKPSVVSKILSVTGVHGHVAAALLAEMQDVQGSACFENCETAASATAAWRPPVLWGRVGKYVLRKAGEKWKARGCGLTFRVCAQEHDVGGQKWAIQRPREE